jgi:hypothetical protein
MGLNPFTASNEAALESDVFLEDTIAVIQPDQGPPSIRTAFRKKVDNLRDVATKSEDESTRISSPLPAHWFPIHLEPQTSAPSITNDIVMNHAANSITTNDRVRKRATKKHPPLNLSGALSFVNEVNKDTFLQSPQICNHYLHILKDYKDGSYDTFARRYLTFRIDTQDVMTRVGKLFLGYTFLQRGFNNCVFSPLARRAPK